jgi:addiction module HigA family antidote
VLPAIGKSVPQMARDIGLSRQHVYDILKEKKPVTAETALRLGKYLGNGPEIWSALQCRYDLAMAEKRMAEELKGIPQLEAA